MIDKRGGDHTTNGIRMGLDGWIYIAVGDYGCPLALGKDGSTVTMRGGIVRVRPDGTDLEIFATGLRNPFDLGIDPFMNLFTRDNDDNRAGGWDIRVSHLIQGRYYGYSQHYANFPDEIMPPLGQFGGGSGTGTLFLQDERWPEKFRNVLVTGDWGRSEVYRHDCAHTAHLRSETGSILEVSSADRDRYGWQRPALHRQLARRRSQHLRRAECGVHRPRQSQRTPSDAVP